MKSFVVVLPVKNEALVLEESVNQLREFLERLPTLGDWQICIADNGSTDETRSIADRLASADSRVRVMHLPEPGRGRALAQVWNAATEDILCYMDIDLSVDLRGLPYMLGEIRRGADVVYGSRFMPASVVERSLLREVLSRGYIFLAHVVLGLKASDAQCGFKAIRRSSWQTLASEVRHPTWFFDTEILARAERRGMNVKGIPVNWVELRDYRRKSTVKIVSSVRDFLLALMALRRELRRSPRPTAQTESSDQSLLPPTT